MFDEHIILYIVNAIHQPKRDFARWLGLLELRGIKDSSVSPYSTFLRLALPTIFLKCVIEKSSLLPLSLLLHTLHIYWN